MPEEAQIENFDSSPWGDAGRHPRRRGGGAPPEEPDHAWRGWIIAVLSVTVVVLASVLYLRKPAAPNVGLQFTHPDRILLGDPFALTISFSNYSDNVLKNSKVSLFLPDGISFVGQSEGQRVMDETVGDIGPGSINQATFNVIATAGAETLKHLTAKLSYSTAQTPTVLENSGEADLLIGQPAVKLSMEIPQNILNGQDFDIKIHYANNTNHDFKNIRLKMDYPPFFRFKRSTMQADGTANNSWDLGTLLAAETGEIGVTGSVIGPEKSFFGFNATLAAAFLGETYTVNSQAVSLSISAAPLAIAIDAVNNNSASADFAKPGDTIEYKLTYTNNSDVVMQNIIVRAKLTGELYDFAALGRDVPFSSLDNEIRWFPGSTPQLLALAPRQSNSLSFSIQLKNTYPIRLLSDKNFTLKVDAQVESPTVPPNVAADETISMASITQKVAGNLTFASDAYWRDAASGILNKGPYPPKVNQPTQYTIHWRIVNYATDFTNIVVSGFLQNSVRFTGVVKSNIGTSPAYDPNSGLVSWKIDMLPATKGVVGPAAEAIFQVEATPSVNLVNAEMPLLGESKLSGTDSFVGTNFAAAAGALDTSLPDDKTVAGSSRGVQP